MHSTVLGSKEGGLYGTTAEIFLKWKCFSLLGRAEEMKRTQIVTTNGRATSAERR